MPFFSISCFMYKLRASPFSNSWIHLLRQEIEPCRYDTGHRYCSYVYSYYYLLYNYTTKRAGSYVINNYYHALFFSIAVTSYYHALFFSIVVTSYINRTRSLSPNSGPAHFCYVVIRNVGSQQKPASGSDRDSWPAVGCYRSANAAIFAN